MKIAIDLTPIQDHLTGVERYNINIVKNIITHHSDDEYILIFKGEVHKEFRNISAGNNITTLILQPCNKLIFIQLRLYRTVKSINADYYMFLSFTSPVLLHKSGVINAIHDLTCWDCPESIPDKMKLYYRLTYKIAVKQSWKIVTVSQFSQSRICDKYHLQKNKVPVIYDGLTDIFTNISSTSTTISKKYKIPNDYILSLSTVEPRKNLQLLIKAYAELHNEGVNLPDLVLAGRSGWKLETITGEISENIRSKIHFTGFVDDVDLPALYRCARLFVFPSLYEGFGLPVIEAMSQGTIVLCSDSSSLPEVAGNYGIIFKSNDIVDLKQKLVKINASGYKVSVEQQDKMIKHAKSFNWSVESDKLYKILQNDLNDRYDRKNPHNSYKL